MKFNGETNDSAVMIELGNRISQARIALSLTQANCAERAAIAKRTVERMEAGESVQFNSLIRVLRVLNLLENFNLAIPEEGPRPMQLLEDRGKIRRRASPPGLKNKNAKHWVWGDEK